MIYFLKASVVGQIVGQNVQQSNFFMAKSDSKGKSCYRYWTLEVCVPHPSLFFQIYILALSVVSFGVHQGIPAVQKEGINAIEVSQFIEVTIFLLHLDYQKLL